MDDIKIRCSGFSGAVGGEFLPDMILHIDRGTFADLKRFIMFACEQSDNYGFIRDGVKMIDEINQALDQHMQIIHEEDDD